MQQLQIKSSDGTSSRSNLPPPLPPKPGGGVRKSSQWQQIYQNSQQEASQSQQLPDLIMNYSQSSIVDKFAQEHDDEQEELAAMGKNAFMPQPMHSGLNALWNLQPRHGAADNFQQQQLNQQHHHQLYPATGSAGQGGDHNISRQPEFESVGGLKQMAQSSGAIIMLQQQHSGLARQGQLNESTGSYSAFSVDQGGQYCGPVVGGGSSLQRQKQQSLEQFHRNSNSTQNQSDRQNEMSQPQALQPQQAIAQDQWQNIIDWVNSFNDPSCLLISEFSDFQDGLAICHLVSAVACNSEDQAQMGQLVHHEHDFDPARMQQNIELALNVLKASSVSLPDAIKRMTAVDIQNSEVHCYMFLETLRQAKNLGIIQLLEQGSPIKPRKDESLMNDESCFGQINENNVFQQSPIELESTQKARRQDVSEIPTIEVIAPERSIHEIMNIDTTLESKNETVPQIKTTMGLEDEVGSAEAILSPTFQPDKLQVMREQMPLQMEDKKSKKSSLQDTPNQRSNLHSANSKKEQKRQMNSQTRSLDKNFKEQHLTPNHQKRSSAINIEDQTNQKTANQNRSRSRTSHQQDSNYKPLFTDSVSQKKHIQGLQQQIQNYDRVIRNSYDRLSANKQVLGANGFSSQQVLQSNALSNRVTPSRMMSQNQNADLIDVAKEELAELERKIQFEQELERQLPFPLHDEQSGEKNNSGRATAEEGSPPRMDSPQAVRQQKQHRFVGNYQQHQQQIPQRVNKNQGGGGETAVDEIDQIMQQMQTLNVEKNEEEIHPVDEKTKFRLLRWLIDDIKLISNQVNPAKLILELPKYCRNGVLFGDLLNRLRGREEVIKGLHRTPKNMTAISANFDKVLGYLKEFPRFSSRHLWSQQRAIEGNQDVIWGLLDDIWHWHFNKISIYDPAQKQSSQSSDLLTITNKKQSEQIENKNLTHLRTSSSIKTKQQDLIGQGQPKMRDYLRNGEKAQNGLRASAQQSMTLESSSRQQNNNNSKKKLHYRHSNSATVAITANNQPNLVEKQRHNFHPSTVNNENNNNNHNQQLKQRPVHHRESNYHSFGMHQESQEEKEDRPFKPSGVKNAGELEQNFENDPNSNNNNRHQHVQQQAYNQKQRYSAAPNQMRPPKPTASQTKVGGPPLLHNLTNISSKKPPSTPLEQVTRVLGGEISARSNNSRNNGGNGGSVNNRIMGIQRSNSQHGSLRKQSLSQFESPRSYGGAFRSHRQQNSTLPPKQINNTNSNPHGMPVPPLSARNSNTGSSYQGLSSAFMRSNRKAGNKKTVHMCTSQDYNNMSGYQPDRQQQQFIRQENNQLSQNQQKQFGSGDSSLQSQPQQQQQNKFTPKLGGDNSAENVVDGWLAHLKFHPFMSAEFDYVSLTEDPRRNGIFIAELVAYLLPQNEVARSLGEGTKINQRPRNVAECQKNWQNIFAILSQLFQQQDNHMTRRLLTKQNMQALMQGDRVILYRLLYSLYQAFYEYEDQQKLMLQVQQTSSAACHSSLGGGSSSAKNPNNLGNTVSPLVTPVEILSNKRRMTPSNSSSNMTIIQQAMAGGYHHNSAATDLELPYTPDEITQLDLSVIQWLKEIGQLKALSIDFEKVDSILDLQGVLRNGVLICALVSRVFKTRITGVFKDPKTETTCISNIRKAMKVLQTSRKMSQKFTWTEQQIFECQRGVILGLFEDIHRVFDGLPPRKRGQTYFDDGPYIGARFQEQFLQAQQLQQEQQQMQMISLDEQSHQDSISQQRFTLPIRHHHSTMSHQ